MPETYTPSQVANMIGRSVSSVRRLTGQYADSLSDYANPPKGEARRYTAEDVAVLQLATQATEAGISRDAILARLDSLPLPPDMPTPTTLTTPPATQPPAALIAVLDSMAEEITARREVERRLATVEAEKERVARFMWLSLAFASIALLIALLVLAAVLFAG